MLHKFYNEDDAIEHLGENLIDQLMTAIAGQIKDLIAKKLEDISIEDEEEFNKTFRRGFFSALTRTENKETGQKFYMWLCVEWSAKILSDEKKAFALGVEMAKLFVGDTREELMCDEVLDDYNELKQMEAIIETPNNIDKF